MLRELSHEELEFVSGGEEVYDGDPIDVNGTKSKAFVESPSGVGGGPGGGSGGYGGGVGSGDGGGTGDPTPWDPNGDDDNDGILNQHEEIVVMGLDAQTMQAMQQASNILAPTLMALGVLGTGGVGTSVGAYYSQLLSAVMGSAKAGEILAYLTGAAAGTYTEQSLANVILEGMIDREQQDLADDGVRNMSWHDTWD